MTGIIIAILILLIPIILILIFDQKDHRRKKNNQREEISYSPLRIFEECRKIINEIVNSDISELGLNREETLKREKQQNRLRSAIREACLGDAGDREYLKEYLKELLQTGLGINEKNICRVIPFDNPCMMSAQDKFEYLYVLYSEKYGNGVFAHMAEDFRWTEPKDDTKGTAYTVTEEDMEDAFYKEGMYGNYTDRLEMLVQRCYQSLYGHDCADILIMDESIDGVSGGVGGRSRVDYNYLDELQNEDHEKQSMNYDTLYCVLHGKLIRLKFLSFKNEENLERVVKNIYRYNIRTSLSRKNPIIHGTLKNGSRIVAARPPVSDGWAFYLRKFKSSNARKIETLLVHENRDAVIELLELITRGELNFCISGPMGGGKTTLLKALVGFMNPGYTIRVAESSFELNLNNVYPERDIHMMQERGDFTIYDIITGTKKMDTDILIVGEVNEPKIAGAYVQVAQSGSRMAVTTLHHETTDKLIEYLRNALVSELGINDVRIAEKQVVDILNFDIHMVHDVEGRFYIERITEIIPDEATGYPDDLTGAAKEYFRRSTDRKLYRLKNIIEFDRASMSYKVCSRLSDHTLKKIRNKTGLVLNTNIWFGKEVTQYGKEA
ncbi:MAG: CpaF/VirB11 family protein [Lachnospiraceae bacterium]|nr:CpaF/VirB11 family protein [Lachnospiraceae bacterium]